MNYDDRSDPILVDTAADPDCVACVNRPHLDQFAQKLTMGQPVLTPLCERNQMVHFCHICQTTHGIHNMFLCQYCHAPMCRAHTVIHKRSSTGPLLATVIYTLGGMMGHMNMPVASCLECFSKHCWAQNIRFHHPRLVVQAPSIYAKRWRTLAYQSGNLPSDARITFGELLAAYELAQRANSELQDRIAVLERANPVTSTNPSFKTLDSLLDTYNRTVEERGRASQYTILDRCNGYDVFPSPGSSPASLRNQKVETVASR